MRPDLGSLSIVIRSYSGSVSNKYRQKPAAFYLESVCVAVCRISRDQTRAETKEDNIKRPNIILILLSVVAVTVLQKLFICVLNNFYKSLEIWNQP